MFTNFVLRDCLNCVYSLECTYGLRDRCTGKPETFEIAMLDCRQCPARYRCEGYEGDDACAAKLAPFDWRTGEEEFPNEDDFDWSLVDPENDEPCIHELYDDESFPDFDFMDGDFPF